MKFICKENKFPDKKIPVGKYFSMWYSDNYDYIMIIENWYIKIYWAEYWSEESIYNEWRENEGWVSRRNNYFENYYDCFDRDTVECLIFKPEGNNADDIAREILSRASENLEDYWHLSRGSRSEPAKDFVDFVKKEYTDMVFTYYK